MFKTLDQQEMLKVNGGFYYVPVYDVYVYYVRFRDRWIVKETRKVRIGMKQVANNSGIREWIRRTIPVYP